MIEIDRSDKKGPVTRVIGNIIIKKYMIEFIKFILFEITFVILIKLKKSFLK